METLRELRDREAPLAWQRALAICRAIAEHELVGTPALSCDAIVVDGDAVRVASLPERPTSGEPGDDGAVRLWKNMQDREAMLVPPTLRVRYMAPEQLAGKPLDETSYVYSIGVIAYELLTGRDVFPDATGLAGLLAAQLERVPAPPSTLVAVPPEVDALVLRCLHKQRTERFASLAALARELADLFAN